MALTKVTGDFIETGSITQGHLHSSHGITLDHIGDGSTNTFFTTADARSAISATGSLSYNNSTGVMSFTMPTLNTTNITEGDKLFFTNARVDSRVDSLSTSDLSEGTNLYFTNARAISALTAGTNIAIASDGTISSTDTNTTYTVGDGGLTQNNFTNTLKTKLDGIAASANNYSLPFTDNSSNWNTAYGWGNHASAGYITSADGGNASTLDGIDSSQFQRNDTGTLPLARMNTVLPTSGNYVWNNATTAGNYNTGVQTAFVSSSQGFPEYGGVLHVGARGGTDAGGDFQIFCGHGSGNGGNQLRVRNADNSATPSDAWTSWRVILDTGNYSSYALPVSGGTMTGELNVTHNGGVTGSSAPSYTQANIEVQTNSNHAPAIGFHRGGYSASTLYEYDGQLYINAWVSRAQNGLILSSGNYSSYALPLSGGTMTGALSIVQGDSSYTFYGPNTTWGGKLYVGASTNKSTTVTASIMSTNGNLHIDPGTNCATYLNYYSNGIIYLNGTTYYISSNGANYNGTAANATTATTANNLAANTSPTIQVLNFTGVGTNSGNANQSYAIYQEGGAWGPPFPDLCIGYHTGIKIGAYSGYNGIRFYNNSDMVTETFSVGNGDNNVRVANNLILSGSDSYIMGGSITSRTAVRAIDVGYANQSCFISASRTSGSPSMIMMGASANQNYIYNRQSGSNTTGRTMYCVVGTTSAFYVHGATGTVHFLNSTVGHSDRLSKKNIEDSDYGLEAINNLRPRRFFWKNEAIKEKQIGFIAQEVEEVLPEAVRGYEGDKGIVDNALLSVLTKAVQELSQQVTDLKAEVELLKQ